MTITYYPKRRKYQSLSSPLYCKKSKASFFNKRFYKRIYLKYFLNYNLSASGFIKTSFFGVCLFALVFSFWLFLFSKNISLNYQVYKLKKEINNLEKQISLIQEKKLNSFSENFQSWLKENNFEEVKNISYLDISGKNLVLK